MVKEEKKFTDREFAEVVHDKHSNIIFLKKKMKSYNLIGNFQQLGEEHIELFNEIKKVKTEERLTWNDAMDKVLSQYGTVLTTSTPTVSTQPANNNIAPTTNTSHTPNQTANTETEILNVLNKILEVLERIDQKL